MYIYNGIPLSHEKKGKSAIYNNRGGGVGGMGEMFFKGTYLHPVKKNPGDVIHSIVIIDNKAGL